MSRLLVALAGDAEAYAAARTALAELPAVDGRSRVLLAWTADDPTAPVFEPTASVEVDLVVDLGELLEPGHPDSWRSEGGLAERGLLLRALTDALVPVRAGSTAMAPAAIDVVVSDRPEHPATVSLLALFPEAVLHPEPVVVPAPVEVPVEVPEPPVAVEEPRRVGGLSLVRRKCRSAARRAKVLR